MGTYSLSPSKGPHLYKAKFSYEELSKRRQRRLLCSPALSANLYIRKREEDAIHARAVKASSFECEKAASSSASSCVPAPSEASMQGVEGPSIEAPEKRTRHRLALNMTALFETADAGTTIDGQIRELIDQDSFYDEILPQDHGVEYFHTEKRKPVGTAKAVFLALLMTVGMYLIISNMLGLAG